VLAAAVRDCGARSHQRGVTTAWRSAFSGVWQVTAEEAARRAHANILHRVGKGGLGEEAAQEAGERMQQGAMSVEKAGRQRGGMA